MPVTRRGRLDDDEARPGVWQDDRGSRSRRTPLFPTKKSGAPDAVPDAVPWVRDAFEVALLPATPDQGRMGMEVPVAIPITPIHNDLRVRIVHFGNGGGHARV
jgi:hypothetical protein